MDKKKRRERRRKTVRKKVFGTIGRPRMCVHKSNKNIVVQIIDDTEGKTLCGVSTISVDLEKDKTQKTRANIEYAKILGAEVAKKAVGKGVTKVVFDRAGYKYHGVVRAVADAARENGLEF
ncbi:MAG: 50S ribosomal protein L18 [Candidatus Omnitrophota bacterium]